MSSTALSSGSVAGASLGLTPLRRNVAMVAVLLTMLMTNIDTSIVNVALPQLSRDLRSSPSDTVWVATAFLMGVSCALPAMSGLADRIGRKLMFVIGTPLFTLASLACALSPHLGILIGSRVVQGIAGSMLFAVAIPIYRRLFPPERLGFVLGMNAMIVALGICSGPALGGVILAHLSWPWLFLINIPIGATATVLGLVFIPHRKPPRTPFDGAGAATAGAAIAAFLLGIHQLADTKTVWAAVALFLTCAALGVLFVRIERRTAKPVIPLQLFNGTTSLALLTAFWSFLGQGAAFIALPFLFQTAFHATPLQSALLFTPWPLMIVIVAPISGRLADVWSSAKLAVIGLIVFTIGLLSLALLGGHPPVWQVLVSTAVTGLGFAIFQSPNNRDMMSSSSVEFASPMAGLLNVNRTLSQSTGAGIVSLALVLAGASGASVAAEASAANGALFVAVAGAALSVVISIAKLRSMSATARRATA